MRVLRTLAAITVLFAFGLGASAAYTVQPGDTLTGIASRFGVSVADLVKANGIGDPDRVQAGRALLVPTSGGGYPLTLRRSPARLALVPAFRRWAAANAIPADLLMAMTWVESGWQNGVVSHTGAVGIGQLMPVTARFIATDLIGRPSLDPRVPEDNIRMSARYLRWLLRRANGEVSRALASYYQGPRSVETVGITGETRLYIDTVLALRKRFAGP